MEVDLDEAPSKLNYEIIRDEGAKIAKGGVNKNNELLYMRRFKPYPRAFFVNHVIKRTEYDKNGKEKKPIFLARFNEYWSEALEVGQKVPVYAEELENLLLADFMIQGKNALGKAGIKLTSEFMRVLLVGFLFAVPFGFFMDAIWGLIPSHIIVWLP